MQAPHRPAGELSRPRVDRVRHELRNRSVEVAGVTRLTPAMVRITFTGSDLADFTAPGFDDHIMIFVPSAYGASEKRDYTPRRFDPATGALVLDFAVHEVGPATQWALQARVGDRLQIAGPKGSTVISTGSGRWLLVGDETALPAIGRRIEEASPGERITSVVAVPGPEDEQTFVSQADVTTHWVHRSTSVAADSRSLIERLRTINVEPQTFVWVAAEAIVARAVRAHVAEEEGQPLTWMKAAGYWVQGQADAHERIG